MRPVKIANGFVRGDGQGCIKPPGVSDYPHVSDIDYVERDGNDAIDTLDESKGKWERIPIKVDSGAVDTAMPPGVATLFPLIATHASQTGIGFRAANSTPIVNHGERAIKGLGDQWQSLSEEGRSC